MLSKSKEGYLFSPIVLFGKVSRSVRKAKFIDGFDQSVLNFRGCCGRVLILDKWDDFDPLPLLFLLQPNHNNNIEQLALFGVLHRCHLTSKLTPSSFSSLVAICYETNNNK